MEELRRYIMKNASISDEEFAMIHSVCTHKTLRPHYYLLQEGDVCRYYAFIVKGCLRTYQVDEDGMEHILYFSLENDWAQDRKSLSTGKPSRYNIQAIENSQVLLFPKPTFENHLTHVPAFRTLRRHMQEQHIIALENRLQMILSYTAEKKIQNLKTHFPDLSNRVPQHMIASFLGISAETLSRIKNKKHV